MGRDLKAYLLVGLSLAVAGVAQAQPRVEARAHFEQGEAYFRAKAYDRAILEYQAAYDLVPEPGLLFNIGLSYENAGDPEQAIEVYQQYLAADPKGAKAAEARARGEALARGIEEAGRARELKAEVIRRRTRAADLAARGDHDAALAELHAVEAMSSDPELVFSLAEVHRGKGDGAAALAEYRRYLGLAATTASHRAEAARQIEELEAQQRTGAEVQRPHPVRDQRPGDVGAPPRLWPGLTVLGAAVSCAGVGLLFGLEAAAIRDELDEELARGAPPLDSRDPRFDDGARAARRSAVFYGIAGAAAVIGGALTARALLHDRGDGKVSVQAAASPGSAMIGLEGAW